MSGSCKSFWSGQCLASNLAGKSKFKIIWSNKDKVIDPKTTKQCPTGRVFQDQVRLDRVGYRKKTR